MTKDTKMEIALYVLQFLTGVIVGISLAEILVKIN
jgi:hypothetical protein